LVRPNTEHLITDSYLTAVIRREHELNRVVFRNRDEAKHVNHEQIASAVLVWFAVITAIDIVLNL